MYTNFGTIPNYNLVSNYAELNMKKYDNASITDKFENAVRQSTTFNKNEFRDNNNKLHNTLSELFYQNDTEIPKITQDNNEHDKELENIKEDVNLEENKENFTCKNNNESKTNNAVLFIIVIVLLATIILLYYFNNKRYNKTFKQLMKNYNKIEFQMV